MPRVMHIINWTGEEQFWMDVCQPSNKLPAPRTSQLAGGAVVIFLYISFCTEVIIYRPLQSYCDEH